MIDPPPPPTSVTATEPPWVPRGLWWRSTWPSVVLALAAFQAGVIATLIVVWGRLGEPSNPSALANPTAGGPTPAVGVSPRTPDGSAAHPEPIGVPSTAPDMASLPGPPAGPSAGSTVASPVGSTRSTRSGARTSSGSGSATSKPSIAATEPKAPARDPGPRATDDALVEVEIESQPEGATVRIAGAVWGVTPLTAFLPSARPTTIDLELAGRPSMRTSWDPASGARALKVDLSPVEHR